MGCVWGKPSPAIGDSPRQRELNRKTSELLVARAVSRKNHEIFSVQPKLENIGDIRIGPKYTKSKTVSTTVRDDYHDIKRVKDSDEICNFPSMGSLPKAVEGEQVAAGWPSWLVTVAGEAIRGWVPRKAETFEKLDKIGQGTYSSVYKGRDLVHNKTVALKKVRFDKMDPESIKFMAREILILRKLDHPNVIKLQGLVTSTTSCSLYLVFEYMEHDLTGLASLPGVKFKEPQVKCYMRQLLSGLDHCHRNGILHRDIKGSNLLIDNHGILKIADFGLASRFDDNQKAPLTSRVVTLWYRPPELLLGATQYGVGVDLWSAGCILGELYAGKPIMPGRTEVEQLHKIFKLCGSPSEDYWRRSKLPHSPVFKPIQPYRPFIEETFKNLPEPSVRLMKTLLSIDPSERGTASSALHSEFFTIEPLACDPSSLPSYPPSKEIDAKRRKDETRRQGVPRAKGHKCEYDNKRSKESRCSAAPITNAGLGRSIQSRHSNANSKCHTDLFSPERDGAAPCTDPWRSHHERVSSSGPHARWPVGALPGRNNTNPSLNETGSRALSTVAPIEKIGSSCVGPTDQAGRFSESFGDPLRKRGGRRPPPTLHGPRDEEPDTISEQYGPGSIHFSGPLPSNNIDRVPKDNDHLIKEAVRRIKQQQKARVGGLWPR